VKRLVLLCLAPLLLAVPAAADCLDDIKGQLARIEFKLAAGAVPPELPPVVPPVVPPATPVTPPAASRPQCHDGGPHVINGMGTVYNVCTCGPAVVSVRNAIPGSRLIVTKTPGSGLPSVPLGPVTVTEGGRQILTCGSTCAVDIGLGDRDFVFRSETPCTNLAVQVR
jgi:hypothetical protein